MKYVLIFYLLISNTVFGQQWDWQVRGDSLFIKNGSDSVPVTIGSAYTSALWGKIRGNMANQSDLLASFNAKANTIHSHAESDITNLVSDLSGKASTSHTHGNASITDLAWGKLTGVPSTFTPSSHTHTESDVTGLTNDLSLKANLASPTFTGAVVLPSNTVTNAMLAGGIDASTKLTGVLPMANGGISGAVAAPATTGTMTVNMTSRIITITPTGACTFNASGGTAGQIVIFSITTSGTSSFTLTWGTNFRKTGTLATGTTSARFFTVTFICLDGTTWTEISRTAVQS